MRKDELAANWLESGRLKVDEERGLVFSPLSNHPYKPLGYRTKKGYLRACVTFSGRRQVHFMVHRIVWISAHGVPPSEKHQINHLNGQKTDNRIANLELVTNAQNMAHAKANGLTRAADCSWRQRDSKGHFVSGKKAAGSLLDGVEYKQFPEPR